MKFRAVGGSVRSRKSFVMAGVIRRRQLAYRYEVQRELALGVLSDHYAGPDRLTLVPEDLTGFACGWP